MPAGDMVLAGIAAALQGVQNMMMTRMHFAMQRAFRRGQWGHEREMLELKLGKEKAAKKEKEARMETEARTFAETLVRPIEEKLPTDPTLLQYTGPKGETKTLSYPEVSKDPKRAAALLERNLQRQYAPVMASLVEGGTLPSVAKKVVSERVTEKRDEIMGALLKGRARPAPDTSIVEAPELGTVAAAKEVAGREARQKAVTTRAMKAEWAKVKAPSIAQVVPSPVRLPEAQRTVGAQYLAARDIFERMVDRRGGKKRDVDVQRYLARNVSAEVILQAASDAFEIRYNLPLTAGLRSADEGVKAEAERISDQVQKLLPRRRK